MASKADIKRYRANLKGEVDGIALYEMLAEAEPDEAMTDLYLRFARTEDRHAEYWRELLRQAGESVPQFRPSFRVRLLGWIARRFGVGTVLPVVRALELAAVEEYTGQPEAESVGMHLEERSHARVFGELARTGDVGRRIAQIEGRHRAGGGNALRAAVMGANDGLVSNLSLVMGVAGADPGRDVVLLAGLSGLLAGSFSMALGEWISVQSSRELYERQIAIEAEEMESMPEEELAELALIYEAKGIEREQAQRMAERIFADRATALETLTREELGIDARELGSPWTAGFTSLALFAGAALVPVLPYFFGGGSGAILASGVVSALALFVLGAAITLFTGRGAWFAGSRQMVIGLVAATITFGIGRLIGASIGLT